jgi:hypothetical protein
VKVNVCGTMFSWGGVSFREKPSELLFVLLNFVIATSPGAWRGVQVISCMDISSNRCMLTLMRTVDCVSMTFLATPFV